MAAAIDNSKPLTVDKIVETIKTKARELNLTDSNSVSEVLNTINKLFGFLSMSEIGSAINEDHKIAYIRNFVLVISLLAINTAVDFNSTTDISLNVDVNKKNIIRFLFVIANFTLQCNVKFADSIADTGNTRSTVLCKLLFKDTDYNSSPRTTLKLKETSYFAKPIPVSILQYYIYGKYTENYNATYKNNDDNSNGFFSEDIKIPLYSNDVIWVVNDSNKRIMYAPIAGWFRTDKIIFHVQTWSFFCNVKTDENQINSTIFMQEKSGGKQKIKKEKNPKLLKKKKEKQIHK